MWEIVVTLCNVVGRTRRPDSFPVAECGSVEWVIFVATLTLGYYVLLITGARTRLMRQNTPSLHSNKLVWSLFYRNLELPELDKINIIKDLLCVKYGLVSLPLFDVSQIDFMLESLCTQ